jgi:hypothetical protein
VVIRENGIILVIFMCDSVLCKIPFVFGMNKFILEHVVFLNESYKKRRSTGKYREKIQAIVS